jgi:hypothetical protein
MASTTSLSRELKGLGDTVRLMPPGVIFKQWIKAEPLKSLNQWHARYAAAPTCSPGALLRGTFGSAGTRWQPYLKGNVWWGSNGFDTVSFNSFGIPTGRNDGATLDGGGGVIRQTDPQRQRLRRCQLSELAEWRVARRPKGQCRPAPDVVRLAADPNAPARSDANIA